MIRTPIAKHRYELKQLVMLSISFFSAFHLVYFLQTFCPISLIHIFKMPICVFDSFPSSQIAIRNTLHQRTIHVRMFMKNVFLVTLPLYVFGEQVVPSVLHRRLRNFEMLVEHQHNRKNWKPLTPCSMHNYINCSGEDGQADSVYIYKNLWPL